ncbi:MAG: RecX family transcriptional regulator [Firmicutes bacterium]|nr:RecX family transcriptional regulator [Bacillota bacterium]
MPKITDMQIQKNNKTRANVYVDGEFAFALEMLTVMKLGLKIGSEISPDKIREAVFDSEKSVAFEKAVNYISRSMKTRSKTKEYLMGKGYSEEVADNVVDRLSELNYLNDETYARLYVEQNSVTKGERRIKQELRQKGVPQQIAEQFCAVDADASLRNAERLAEKYMRNRPRDLKTLQKLQRYLLGRGYSFDTVNGVLRGYNADDDM